ncbi:hypothetical protein CJ468_06469 [Nocardia farcinica]|nr:hypothetical protein CJ468_06469 [Nocardia farcinica]
MSSSAPIEGRATPIIETSSPSRNSTTHSVINIPHSRTGHFVGSSAGAAAAESVAGEVMPGTLHACALNANT